MKGIVAQNLGMGRATLDGRYVARFVGATLAADSRLQNLDGGGTEPTLNAPNGAVQGRWPSDSHPMFNVANDAFRGTTRIRVVRSGASGGGGFFGVGINGTIQAPTQMTTTQTAVSLGGNGVNNAGALTALGLLQLVSREAITAAAAGSYWDINLNPVGSAAQVNPFRLQAGSSSIGEFLGRLATTRFIPTSTGQLRNPANTSSVVEWGADTLGFFNTAPTTKKTVTGSRAGNAAPASLLTQLASYGIITDSTTA